jgi:parvulin-like peptidyl-prolyl isomerase
MDNLSFLSVDEVPISLSQAVKHLQVSGKLGQFIKEILRQYVLEQELQTREDLDINPDLTSQAIIDFRLQNKLTEPPLFQEWLQKNGTDYAAFQASVTSGFKLEKLKVVVSEAKLQEHFIENKIFLDRVVLSRIIVDKQELAEELQAQIEEGAGFEQLAKEYSMAEDRIVNGMMGPVSRGTMPDILRSAIDEASPGKIVGPIELDGRWGLFRIEQFIPATLDDPQLKQALQNELFEKWLAEKIQKLTVKMQVN